MKIPFFLIVVFSVFCFAACDNSNGNPAVGSATGADKIESDSIKAQALDAYVKSIDDNDVNLITKQVPLKLHSERDAALVVWDGEDIVRAGVALKPAGIETRTAYYLKDNKLQFYHHREWHKDTNPPRALQLFCYFDENGIFKAQQRTMTLQQNEKPGGIISMPLVDCPLNKDSLSSAVLAEWDLIKKTIDNNK